MAKSKAQEKRSKNPETPRTPKRKREDEKHPTVGSSCTWRRDELDRFQAKVSRGVDAKHMIPIKFFNFTGLEKYQKRILSPLFRNLLDLGIAELTAVSQDDLSHTEVIDDIENATSSFFRPLSLLLSVEPDTRQMTLSKKRRKSYSQPIRNESSTQSSHSSRRIPSGSSMSDPSQDSAGGVRILAVKEKTVDTFANQLVWYVISGLWPGGVSLDWVRGRDSKTTLRWNDAYTTSFSLLLTDN